VTSALEKNTWLGANFYRSGLPTINMSGPGSKEDLAFITSGIANKTGKPWRKE
jgi:hypothetical protein